tara:strand:- start:1035 stop:1154 length:120 start_codon:yes stop_codon:yes gene_type:complete
MTNKTAIAIEIIKQCRDSRACPIIICDMLSDALELLEGQ